MIEKVPNYKALCNIIRAFKWPALWIPVFSMNKFSIGFSNIYYRNNLYNRFLQNLQEKCQNKIIFFERMVFKKWSIWEPCRIIIIFNNYSFIIHDILFVSWQTFRKNDQYKRNKFPHFIYFRKFNFSVSIPSVIIENNF